MSAFLLRLTPQEVQIVRDFTQLFKAWVRTVEDPGGGRGERPEVPNIGPVLRDGLVYRRHLVLFDRGVLSMRAELARRENRRRRYMLKVRGDFVGRIPASIEPSRPAVFLMQGNEAARAIKPGRRTSIRNAWDNPRIRAWLIARGAVNTRPDSRWPEGAPYAKSTFCGVSAQLIREED